MGRDLTTPTDHQEAADAGRWFTHRAWPSWSTGDAVRQVRGIGTAMVLGALLIALLYQLPVTHIVDIGGYDEAYVQGFYDPEAPTSSSLQGSDGSARWTHNSSYLVFPQIGLPAQATLRLRGGSEHVPGEVVILLNGDRELGRFQVGSEWREYTVTIDGGLLKPSDVVLEIRAPAAPLSADDPRPVGVLLDWASYRTSTPPILPYPAQLVYGALAAGMLYVLTRRTTNDQRPTTNDERLWSSAFRLPSFVIYLLALLIAFLLLYRLQPLYPYPLRRLLPLADLALLALLALRYGPSIVRRLPVLFDWLALGGMAAWTVAILLAARNHLVLSLPGVENDFGVFARRSSQLTGRLLPGGVYSSAEDGVFRADGFYNLGYPLLLWLMRPFTQDNPFLAAQLIAGLSGAVLLGAAWWLARSILGRGPALLALIILALSPLVVEYALYLGSDLPFAALCTLTLALLIPTKGEGPTTKEPDALARSFVFRPWSFVLAGLVAGAAFLVRHPGLLLLLFGWLVIWTRSRFSVLSSEVDDATGRLKTQNSKLKTQSLLLFTLAFLLTIAPQLYVNVRDTGQPLYNQQAKNIWLCVHGSCDWGRWDEAPNSVTLGEIVLRAPGRFLAHWWANLRGFAGAGGEDTSEFGHAIQLRLLGFPANWLALGGLLAWLVMLFRRGEEAKRRAGGQATQETLSMSPCHLVTLSLLLTWVALYALTVSVGISLPRFFLPLTPIYAIAAAWTVAQLWRSSHPRPGDQPRGMLARQSVLQQTPLLAALLLLALLWGGFASGTGYVLRNQDADEVAATQLVQATLRPGERLEVRAPPRVLVAKYSSIAHLVVPSGGRYLLAFGGDAPDNGTIVGAAGQYTLYRLAP